MHNKGGEGKIAITRRKPFVETKDLVALAKLNSYPEIEVFWKMLDNRAYRDRNSIVSLPEVEPVRLAIQKAFFRGRISAVMLIKKQIQTAAKELERIEEEPKKKK